MKHYTRRAEDALKLSMSFGDVVQFYLTQIHMTCKDSIVHVVHREEIYERIQREKRRDEPA